MSVFRVLRANMCTNMCNIIAFMCMYMTFAAILLCIVDRTFMYLVSLINSLSIVIAKVNISTAWDNILWDLWRNAMLLNCWLLLSRSAASNLTMLGNKRVMHTHLWMKMCAYVLPKYAALTVLRVKSEYLFLRRLTTWDTGASWPEVVNSCSCTAAEFPSLPTPHRWAIQNEMRCGRQPTIS